MRSVLHGSIEDLSESDLPSDFQAFKSRKDALSVHKGCLLWGNQAINPQVYREYVLNLLHRVHQGIGQTKSVARSLCLVVRYRS